jgi:hypothetical protein
MAYFQFESSGDVFTAIPEAHGGLGCHDIDRGCDCKYQPSQDVVVFPVQFHQELRIRINEDISLIMP